MVSSIKIEQILKADIIPVPSTYKTSQWFGGIVFQPYFNTYVYTKSTSVRSNLSTIPTYNSHLNSHVLLSKSENSSKKNSPLLLIVSPIDSWCLWCQIWGAVHTYMWSMTSIQQQCFNGSHQVEMRHDRSTRGWWGNSVTSFGQIDHKGKSFVIGLWALRKKKLIWDWKMTFNIVYYSKPHKK